MAESVLDKRPWVHFAGKLTVELCNNSQGRLNLHAQDVLSVVSECFPDMGTLDTFGLACPIPS